MGADYEDVFARLRKDERIQKFLLKVMNDKSYDLLCSSLESGDMAEAFRAAHTLKGVCQNLSLTPLYKSAAVLSDRLKEQTEYGSDIEPMLDRVREDYERTISCIRELDGQ